MSQNYDPPLLPLLESTIQIPSRSTTAALSTPWPPGRSSPSPTDLTCTRASPGFPSGSGSESACQCRGHGFHSRPRKGPHATGQPKPALRDYCSWRSRARVHNKRNHHNQTPAHHSWRADPTHRSWAKPARSNEEPLCCNQDPVRAQISEK